MFEVKIRIQLLKYLEKIGEEERKRILSAIERFVDPFSQPYEKLKGRKNIYRIRVGDYRVIYLVDKKHKIVSVLIIDKRERVYDRI